MTKYFISYTYLQAFSSSWGFGNKIIDMHPFEWQATHMDKTLLSWKEITKEDMQIYEDSFTKKDGLFGILLKGGVLGYEAKVLNGRKD
jgi:hypothetical protein